ncbi:SLAP domain-containing protein [Companilactobacillus keshanensis]|uniref:SLAP domain-containing protein n=1 Tax=Companilactobacillus keshanensis TaxID=2486003 RepID=A0ABW4BTN8_9LACO|nr:SLAP domain-containing protein [Companilactobacillus keshanensis]
MNLKYFTHRINSEWILVSILTMVGGLILPGSMLINVRASDSVNSAVIEKQANYTINYLDADTKKVIGSRTGNAAVGSFVTIPEIKVAGYSSKFSENNVFKLTNENEQTITVTMKAVADTHFILLEREANEDDIKRTKFDIKANDPDNQKIIAENLNKLQRGRRISFVNSWVGNVGFNDLPYLKGMEDDTAEEIFQKIFDEQGNNEDLSNNDHIAEVVFNYLPLDTPHEEHYIAKGGYLDGQLIFVDKVNTYPTVNASGIGVKDAVSGYSTENVDQDDISYNRKRKILTYKVPPVKDASFVFNELDKNGKPLKNFKITVKANSKIDINDKFFSKLFLNRKVILDKTFYRIFSSEGEIGEMYLSQLNYKFAEDLSLKSVISQIIKNMYLGNIVPEELSDERIEYNIYLEDDSNQSVKPKPSPVTNKPIEIIKNIATATQNVRLYDKNGKLITNRELSSNTKWKNVLGIYINKELCYQISADEYVKSKDVYVYTDTDTSKIKVKSSQGNNLVDHLGTDLDRDLRPLSEWKTDLIASIKDKKYYRVSTDEFIELAKVLII